MKAAHLAIYLALILTLVTLMMAVGDFLALHDIQDDYVSQEILQSLNITLSDELPEWTATEGEWAMVAVSVYSRPIFLLLNAAALVLCLRMLRGQGRSASGDAAPSG
jgi:hypothetical protein